MAIEELKIRQKCEDMIMYAYVALKQFPKSERFALVVDIKRSMFRVHELIVRCNKSRDKKKYIYDIDVELDILRSVVRMSAGLGFLPFKKYEILSGYLVEIGKMVGGWLKYINTTTKNM